MKKLLLATMISFAPFAIPPAHTSDLTGEALALACEGNVPNVKKEKRTEEYAKFCNAYINGWDDARFAFLQGTRTYCPPQTTVKELSVIFFDYLAEHKEARKLPAAEALMLAFKDKWPCHVASGAQAGGPMYNTPDKDVRVITKIVGRCDTDDSYIAVFLNGDEHKTPIQCDYGVMMELPNGNWLVNFAYGDHAISFGGVYNNEEKRIDIDQFWPGPSPVDAVNRVTVNGLIDKNLDSKCFHEAAYIACGARYQDDNNSFFYSLKITYKKLIDITEQTKRLRKRNYR